MVDKYKKKIHAVFFLAKARMLLKEGDVYSLVESASQPWIEFVLIS